MAKIASNIRILRDLKKLTQEQLAEELSISRSSLGAYEESRANPPYDLLIKFSDYFHVSIDALIRGDLAKTNPDALMKIGKNRILFPIKVDESGNDLIEVVPVKASAGYTTGYADPEFIDELPIMNLPFKIVGKHRAFTIKGDSMPPLKAGTIVVGKYIEHTDEIKDGQTYIVLTKSEGLVYKRLYRSKKSKAIAFEFHSDNSLYKPYLIASNEIKEVWGFVCSLNFGEIRNTEMNIESVISFLQSYRVEMKK